jgi:hypothetical protein
MFDLAEGLLPADEARALQEHISVCAACSREWTHCRSAAEALTGACTAIPDCGDLRTAFYARLIASCRPSPCPVWLKALVAAPFAAAAVAGVLLLAAHSQRQPAPGNAAANAAAQQRIAEAVPAGPGVAALAQHRISPPERRTATGPQITTADKPNGATLHHVGTRQASHRSHGAPGLPQLARYRNLKHAERAAARPRPAMKVASNSEGDVALAVCDEERGFVASTRMSRRPDGVIELDTKSAPAAALISTQAN